MKALLLAATLLAQAPPPSIACFAYDAVAAALDRHGERLLARGTLESGAVIEIWGDGDGTFTLIVKIDNRLGCPLGSGQDWQFTLERRT